MAHVDNHAPGAFSWIELGTSDQHAAKHFYTNLFGWTFQDNPMGPDDVYTMFGLDDRNVAGAYTLHERNNPMHVPPHWNVYITVASAEEAAKRAAALGARILEGPFDVQTYGRMVVVMDPAGAVFSLWEPKTNIGFSIKDQHGSFCWADLSTPDQSAAAKFYADLFGWTLAPGEGGYLHVKNGEDFIGGIPPAEHRRPGTPPHWMIYIQVDDCDASTAKAQELGARVYMGPMTMENVGRMTVLADPQGAVLALFQPMRRG